MTSVDYSRDLTIQDDEPAIYGGGFGGHSALFGIIDYQPHQFPAWGNPRRDYYLRQTFYDWHNSLVVGALANLIRRVKQTPWEISGGRNLTHRYQEVLQNAQFGGGWDAFLSRLLQDLLTTDNGAFVELIGPGEPDTPLTQQVTGTAVLDSLRSYATGNWEYPVYYQSHRTGRLHKLHWSRVVRLADTPSPDPLYRGLGLCALSRALSVSRAEVLMSKYMLESLSDMPPKGFLVMSGPTRQQWEQVRQVAEFERQNKQQEVFRNLVQIDGVDPENPLKVELIPFSGLPDHFDRRALFDIHVQMLANAIGDDPQEIAALSSSGLGATATQSHVLNEKGKGRIYGDLLTMLERVINIAILPVSLEFKFKRRDTDQSRVDADTAKAWTDNVVAMLNAGLIDVQAGARLLANTVDSYADVLLDQAGNVRLPDDDRQPEVAPVVLQDDAPTPAQANAEPVNLGDNTTANRTKSIQAVRLNFEGAFEDALQAAQQGRLSRQRFGVVLRNLMARFGRQAYEQGLQDGGVDPRDATDEDAAAVRDLVLSQAVYIRNFIERVWSRDRESFPLNTEARASMWFNKSISPFYDAGLMSADRNGMYEWILGPT
ncbi:DUF1073 domain-containing protein, partial [bacterium]|nr:DUF1073 domain-containing protein [bacterium]